jgi:uncharacterized Zn-finger protein
METLERDLSLGAWENEGGLATFVGPTLLPPGVPCRGQRRGVPRFRNDVGSPIVEIGVRGFNCIGATPPADHPHVYLDMGELSSILCPYCATRFQFDAALHDGATRPAGCAYDKGDVTF